MFGLGYKLESGVEILHLFYLKLRENLCEKIIRSTNSPNQRAWVRINVVWQCRPFVIRPKVNNLECGCSHRGWKYFHNFHRRSCLLWFIFRKKVKIFPTNIVFILRETWGCKFHKLFSRLFSFPSTVTQRKKTLHSISLLRNRFIVRGAFYRRFRTHFLY